MRRASLAVGNTFSTHTLDLELAIEPELRFTEFAQYRIALLDLDNIDLTMTEACGVLVNNTILEGSRKVCGRGADLDFGFLHDQRLIGKMKELEFGDDVGLV